MSFKSDAINLLGLFKTDRSLLLIAYYSS